MEPALLFERTRGAVAVPVHQELEPAAAPPPFNRGNGKGLKGQKRKLDKVIEACFAWSRNAGGCQEPCPQGRRHACEGCGAANVRGVNCCLPNGPTKKAKGKGGKGGKKK